jgi:steroid delta-isomerase-like uncharacterized protein
MPKENIEIVHSYLEKVWNGRRVELIEAFFAENSVLHNLPAHMPPNRKGIKMNVDGTVDAFPNFTIAIEDTIAQQDKVAVRLTFSGTHQGGFYGMPATGKSFSISAIAIARLADGKIAEWWQIGDTLGLLQQIGAMPAPRN